MLVKWKYFQSLLTPIFLHFNADEFNLNLDFILLILMNFHGIYQDFVCNIFISSCKIYRSENCARWVSYKIQPRIVASLSRPGYYAACQVSTPTVGWSCVRRNKENPIKILGELMLTTISAIGVSVSNYNLIVCTI